MKALVAALVVVLLLTGCICRSSWFRRCGPPRGASVQVVEYSVQRVAEPLPWRLCFRYGPSEPWVQVWGSPGFASEEEAQQALLEALKKERLEC